MRKSHKDQGALEVLLSPEIRGPVLHCQMVN